jgi:hypothetical protein
MWHTKKSKQERTLGKGKEEDMKTRKLKKLKNKTTTKTKTEFTGHQKKKSTNSKEAANSH